MIAYFDELSAVIAGGDSAESQLDGIARRAGMEVVGPVLDGYL